MNPRLYFFSMDTVSKISVLEILQEEVTKEFVSRTILLHF